MNMASFAANIGFKFSCHLQSRVSSISCRIMWKGQIQCLKSRDNISYVPFRYIFKTSSKVTISETVMKSSEKSNFPSRPNVSVANINGGKGGHGRIARCESSQNLNEIHNNLLFDDNGQGLHGCEQIEEDIEAVEDLTIQLAEDSFERDLLQNKKFTDAEESAIKLLAARALTTVELRKKLHVKRFSPGAVEAVINKFQSRGLINDRLYAESFSRSRWSSSSWGPRRINQALYKKGISQADAEKALELVFKDNDSDGNQKSVISLSKHSMDHLYAQASKQWLRGLDVPKETRKARIVRWLQYRGFAWDVINFILKKLDRQDPP